jgi:hypothetical protein
VSVECSCNRTITKCWPANFSSNPSQALLAQERPGIFWRPYHLKALPDLSFNPDSLIHACASALDLEVYCITLATEGLTDAVLLKAMTLIPPGGVVVMEDVDVAIPKSSNEGLNRDEEPPKKDDKKGKKGEDRGSAGGHITLSGRRTIRTDLLELQDR